MSEYKLSADSEKFLKIVEINQATNVIETIRLVNLRLRDLLAGGLYEEVNEILRLVGPKSETMQPSVLLAFLTETLESHSMLPYRGEFYRCTRQAFLRKYDEVNTNSVLRGQMPENLTDLKDQVTQIEDKIEATVVKAPVKVQVESDFSQEIKVMMDKVDKQLKARELEQEKKFHRREIVRHEQAIDALDKRLSEL